MSNSWPAPECEDAGTSQELDMAGGLQCSTVEHTLTDDHDDYDDDDDDEIVDWTAWKDI